MHIVPVENIQNRILLIRGHKVILDSDLSKLYGVSTMRLNEQVKRNTNRFPEGFVFQLTKLEKREVIAICDNLQSLKFSPVLPNAFTEHGALMAATVLRSERASKVSVFIIKAFVEMRERAITHRDVIQKLNELEYVVGKHDEKIRTLFRTIKRLVKHKKKPSSMIGFNARN